MNGRDLRWFLPLVAAVVSPVTANAQAPQVISRAELDAAGLTRLSELFFVVRGVARSSVDGITVGGSLSGVPGWQLTPGHSSWQVLVDGQPVDVDAAGTTALDLLPVSLAQLDSVTVRRTPVIVGGRMAMHGVLHLHTQRIAGLRASASHYSGNEVGDPGPFAFTPAATPNVDNNGPFHQLRLAYGTGAADVDLALRRWADNLTDIRLRQRYIDAASPAAPHLWVNHIAPTARAGFHAFGLRHDVHAGTAQTSGTFFVPAAREDQSLATRLTFTGLSGSTHGRTGKAAGAADRNTDATYRIALSSLEMSPDGAMPATLAHRRRQVGGGFTLTRTARGASLTAGLSATHRSIVDAPALLVTPEDEIEADIDVTIVPGGGQFAPTIGASVGSGIAGVRGGAVVGLTHVVDARTTVQMTAAARTRAQGDDGAWIDLALFGLESLAGSRRTSMSASAEWNRVASGGARVSAAATGRRELGLHVIAPGSGVVLPALRDRTGDGQSLNTAELRAAIDLPFGGALLGGAVYRFTTPVGGSSEIRSAAAMIPQHVLDATVTVVPAFDIRIRPALHLASATRWLAGAPGDDERVPAIVRLDLSIEKWLLARRLRLQVAARNLTNGIERYHPLGADFRLRVFAGATATF